MVGLLGWLLVVALRRDATWVWFSPTLCTRKRAGTSHLLRQPGDGWDGWVPVRRPPVRRGGGEGPLSRRWGVVAGRCLFSGCRARGGGLLSPIRPALMDMRALSCMPCVRAGRLPRARARSAQRRHAARLLEGGAMRPRSASAAIAPFPSDLHRSVLHSSPSVKVPQGARVDPSPAAGRRETAAPTARGVRVTRADVGTRAPARIVGLSVVAWSTAAVKRTTAVQHYVRGRVQERVHRVWCRARSRGTLAS
jgi:hypothetical protein